MDKIFGIGNFIFRVCCPDEVKSLTHLIPSEKKRCGYIKTMEKIMQNQT